MKTETTKKLEALLAQHFDSRKDFYVFECTIGWYGKEIVDCINYDCNRMTTCYEIKQSVSDFRSKNALTFIGDKNYFVMPYELYEKVKDEIPHDIGCYVACSREAVTSDRTWGQRFEMVICAGFDELYCIKRATKRPLRADKEVILSSMLRCACRDRARGSIFAVKECDGNA